MPLDAPHCALCLRRDSPLLEVGSAAPFICTGCARRIGRHILERAGHAVVWDLEARATGALPDDVKHASRLLYEELLSLRQDPPAVSMETFDGPVYEGETPKELLLWARVHLDVDVREGLKRAAELLLRDDLTPELLAGALRVAFHPRILRRDGLDRLRSLVFRE